VHNDLLQQWLETTDAATQAHVNEFAGTRLRRLVLEGGYGLYEIIGPGVDPAG
jgi:hypothetical protein